MSDDAPPPFDFDAVPGSRVRTEGFTHAEFDVIFDWIREHVPEEERPDVWWSALWWGFDGLTADFGEGARWHNGEYLSVLTTRPERAGAGLLRDTEALWERVRRLHAVPLERAPSACVLVFSDVERYYDYYSHFSSDGEHAASAAVCIFRGEPHIIVAPGPDWTIRPTLAHELSHLFGARYDWPLWLDEGLAQMAEEVAGGSFEFSREDAGRMRLLWTPETIQNFWRGESWGHPDDRNRLSYLLAQILCRRISNDFGGGFRAFLEDAVWADGGAAAAREHLGVSLSDLVSGVLGAGDWEPAPDSWPAN
jgi:hypothetical protein